MHVSFLLQLLLVLLKDSLAHQWRAGHWLCSGGQYPALTREDPSLDTDCATAMAPPLWTLQERGADSMCWLDWLHSPATLCKWQQSMLEGLDHTVQLSLWRRCRIVSILHNNSWCQVNICLYTASVDSALVDAFNCTAVRVSWTPLNIPMVDHYTVHYTNIACGNSLSETLPSECLDSGVRTAGRTAVPVQWSLTGKFSTYIHAAISPVTDEEPIILFKHISTNSKWYSDTELVLLSFLQQSNRRHSLGRSLMAITASNVCVVYSVVVHHWYVERSPTDSHCCTVKSIN